MVDLRDHAATFRQFVTSILMPAAGKHRAGGSDPQIYARARPELVRLTERYFVRQEISGNPQKYVSARPTGAIEITVPYDGYDCFTRQACADVKLGAARQQSADPRSHALVGHLVLANYNRTNLGDVLGLRQRYGSVPIHVPITGLGAVDDVEGLQADQRQCVINYGYTPDLNKLKVIPIGLEVDLLDPDSIDSHLYEVFTSDINSPPPKMTQQVSFRPHLILRVVVRLNVPKTDGWEKLRPRVANVSLHWPTITSLRAVKLRVAGEEPPVRYNPLLRSIEWSDVEMAPRESGDDSDTVTYLSEPMLVLIEQPGELYRQESLEGSVEVRIDDYLLSGVEARLANGLGRLARDDQPEHVTFVEAEMKLILDDAFAKRMVSPYQHLYFDEVIPDSRRIDDIEAALKDRGFDVEVGDKSRLDAIHLRAERSEGPNKMVLWLEVQGRTFETERENKRPGGHTYKSTFESGELKVFIRGTFQRDSAEVVREMNALQQALRERFDRLRQNR